MGTQSELIIYTTEDDKTQVAVRLDEETVWLTQEQMAESFQRDKSTISRHISFMNSVPMLTQDEVFRQFGLKSERVVLGISISGGNPKGERKRQKCENRSLRIFANPLWHTDFAPRKV